MERRMNLKEFARIVGLSPTTVSRGLNGHPEVSERTRARLIEAARQHGYAPNAHARSLAMGHASTIGCVIPTGGRDLIVNPIYADFLAGVGEVCAARGVDINLSVVPDDGQEATYRAMKARGLVGGAILQLPRLDDPRPALLHSLGLPFVVHGRISALDEQSYSWVDVNNRRAFHRATGFLLQLGHRRIALLNGAEHWDFAFRRRQGYLSALANSGIAPDPALMTAGEMSLGFAYAAAWRMLSGDKAPTAFLTSSIIMATGVAQALDEMGLRLGEDISVVTFDDDLSYHRNPQAVPRFTAMRSSVRDAGSRVARMLIELIGQTHPDPVQEVLEAQLVVGRSTAPPRKG